MGAPKIVLGYDSSAVDGKTADTNNQPSWIGEGWDYTPGYVERSYVPCSDDPRGVKSQTEDLCWYGNVVSLNLSGHSTQLVRASDGSWTPATDDGTRVELLTNGNNGDAGTPGAGDFSGIGGSGEYWKVTTPDGTAYWFGLNYAPGGSASNATNSTWTVPVYGAQTGDPCNDPSGFAASRCMQAWRWNLAYVEDVHGNASAYYYSTESNAYSANKSATANATYTRAGQLKEIDYGLRNVAGSVFGSPTPNRVLFATADRPTGSYTDVPTDQECTQGATCSVTAPTFWSKKKLSTITTQVTNGSGGYSNIDSYTLTSSVPSDMLALRLDSISRTGYTGGVTAGDHGSGPATTPSTDSPTTGFTYQLYANRVLGYNSMPAMARWRMTSMKSETGGIASIFYSPTQCTSSNLPAASTAPTAAATNTMRCFPVYWRRPYTADKTLDWFHKYVVTEVDQTDPNSPATQAPTRYTLYKYLGNPAWHFDDNELVVAANRTWAQWRGYGQVETRTGSPTRTDDAGVPDKWTLNRTTFFRGMNLDTLPNSGTRAVQVTNSLGERVDDTNEFAGQVFEAQQFDSGGAGSDTASVGTQLSTTITNPVRVAKTATRTRSGVADLVATVDGVAKSRTFTTVFSAGGTSQRSVVLTNALDSIGRVVQTTSSGTNVPDTCTRTSYAGASGTGTTTGTILDRVAEVSTSAEVCPAVGSAQGALLTDARTYYDDSTTLGTLSADGDATLTKTANTAVGAPLGFASVKSSYDAAGRVTSVTVIPKDGTPNRVTKTAYTPADGGLLSQVKTTDPLGHIITSTLNARGETTHLVDIAGNSTDATYDSLGRLTGVWKPGQAYTGASATPATTAYSYLLASNAPEAVTTTSLVDTGTTKSTTTQVQLFDALGTLRQTQVTGASGGRTMTDAFVDSHGWVVETNNHYFDPKSAPTTTLMAVPDANVDSRTLTTYDGTGRPVRSKDVVGASTTPTRQTTTVYSGDRTTVFPPAGSTTASSVTDARGNVIERDQYLTAPTVAGNAVSGGTFQATTYGFTALDQPNATTDVAGNQWTTVYDMAGRKISQTDPDTGTTTTTYNDANNVLTVTDARNVVRQFTYDLIGRQLTSTTGPTATPIAKFVWDTIQPGQLTSSTSYLNGDTTNPYVVTAVDYDVAGRQLGTDVSIPASEGALGSKTYRTTQTYSTTGLPRVTSYQAGGGLPQEAVTVSYNTTGLPLSTIGTNQYVLDSTYDGYGHLTKLSAHENQQITQLNVLDAETFRLTNSNITTPSSVVDNATYTYDASGNLTRAVDERGDVTAGSPVRTMCYRYDALVQLSAAWSAVPNDTCSTQPLPGKSTTVGGDHPQWQTWAYTNNIRTQQTDYAVPGGLAATRQTTYTNGSIAGTTPDGVTTIGSHPTALASSRLTSGSTTASNTYGYDASGNTTTRVLVDTPTAGSTTKQTLSWTADNRLATVHTDTTGNTVSSGDTSYVYAADGSQLIRHDPSQTVLYLPGQELVLSTSGATSGIVTGTRWYSHASQSIAERIGATTVFFLAGDRTSTMAVTWRGYFDTTRRTLDPFGNMTGALTLGPWPDQHGFLNKSQSSATGLTDIGARNYDSVTGRFQSADPLLKIDDPVSLPAYGYANNNPVTNSDSTGLQYNLDDMSDGPSNPAPPKPQDPVAVASAANTAMGGQSGFRSVVRQAYLSPGAGDAPVYREALRFLSWAQSNGFIHPVKGQEDATYNNNVGWVTDLGGHTMPAHMFTEEGYLLFLQGKPMDASVPIGLVRANSSMVVMGHDGGGQGTTGFQSRSVKPSLIGDAGALRGEALAPDETSIGSLGYAIPNPSPVFKPNGSPDRKGSPWYVQYRDADGNLQTMGNVSKDLHVEARIQQAAPGTPMSMPFGWRATGSGKGPEWVVGTVCVSCQQISRSLFPPGTKGAHGGPWGEGE